EVARLGRVRVELYNVPVSMETVDYARKHKLPHYDLALYGGEEYEMVVTVRKAGWPSALRAVLSLITVGKVTKGSGVFARIEGRRIRVKRRGYAHIGERDRT